MIIDWIHIECSDTTGSLLSRVTAVKSKNNSRTWTFYINSTNLAAIEGSISDCVYSKSNDNYWLFCVSKIHFLLGLFSFIRYLKIYFHSAMFNNSALLLMEAYKIQTQTCTCTCKNAQFVFIVISGYQICRNPLG